VCSIEWEGLKKSYTKVTLTYQDRRIEGQRTILLGGNGSGKSTLLKMMLGWVHHDGTMRIDGRLSYMPEMPAFPRDVDAATFLRVLEEGDPVPWFERFGLSMRHSEPIHHFSKGMRGKLNAIQCLMKDADWYLFDEPENGLDDAGWRVLRSWLANTEKRWIITTHLPDRYQGLQAEVIRLDP
jgi:ABC-2 type transport system ATP-binding protein